MYTSCDLTKKKGTTDIQTLVSVRFNQKRLLSFFIIIITA